MLIRTAGPPFDGMCSSRIVSERSPSAALSEPVASCFSCAAVRPWRLSEPVISQFWPAETAGRPE